MFTTRINPKLSVKPLASRNSSAANETPLIAWRTPLFMRNAGIALAAARAAAPCGRRRHRRRRGLGSVQPYRLYGPRLRNSSGFQVQNCETFS